MKLSEMTQMISSGARPVVEFSAGMDDYYLEKGMRATAVEWKEDIDDVVIIVFEFKSFYEFNKPFEGADWYNPKTKRNDLTATASGHVPDDFREKFYFMKDDDVPVVLVDEKQQDLFRDYEASGFDGSYVTWLESKVLS